MAWSSVTGVGSEAGGDGWAMVAAPACVVAKELANKPSALTAMAAALRWKVDILGRDGKTGGVDVKGKTLRIGDFA
jgi:hypothetical protein